MRTALNILSLCGFDILYGKKMPVAIESWIFLAEIFAYYVEL